MNLISVSINGQMIEVRPKTGGEKIVCALYNSILGKSHEVESFGIPQNKDFFAVYGNNILEEVKLSKNEAAEVERFFNCNFHVAAINSSPESGFRFVAD